MAVPAYHKKEGVTLHPEVCKFSLQYDGGRSLEEKLSFYDELKCEWDLHSAGDLVMCLGYFNVHVDRHIDGVHGWFGVGQRNLA